MKVDLLIAGNGIRLCSDDQTIISPDERFSAFRVSDLEDPDLLVEVRTTKGVVPSSADKVFDARHMSETPEGSVVTDEPFWEVAVSGDTIYITVYLAGTARSPLLVIPRGKMTWQIFSDEQGEEADPLPWPVDGLLLYFLAVIKGDILLHGSGVTCAGSGWIFSGRSGSGKTTLAKIFDRRGDRVIHDDRLMLRKEAGRWVMYSTPVYRNDEPRSAAVDHLWLISHGRSNVSSPVEGAEAAALVLSNCIQQNWDREASERLVTAVGDLTSSVRVSRLSFVPDDSIREYIMARETTSADIASHTASALLSEGREVMITAGGYSMWPAIKPGEKVIITPVKPDIPLAPGMVVALKRDGGFVVHRIAEFRMGKLSNFIRTRGDTSLISDPWTTVREVAGLVKKIGRDGQREFISQRRMPYFAGAAAVMVMNIWCAAVQRLGRKKRI